MVQQVVASSRAQPLWQPAAHVRAPMNFLKRDVINREAGEYSSGPSIAEDPLQEQKWRSISKKKRDDSQRIAGKINVPGRFRGIQCRVMHHVLLAKNAAARVQDEPVQAIFKSVGIKKTKNEAA